MMTLHKKVLHSTNSLVTRLASTASGDTLLYTHYRKKLNSAYATIVAPPVMLSLFQGMVTPISTAIPEAAHAKPKEALMPSR